jgi:hypothetical protein
MKVFENRLFRKVIGPKRYGVTETSGHCIIRTSRSAFLIKHCAKIKKIGPARKFMRERRV